MVINWKWDDYEDTEKGFDVEIEKGQKKLILTKYKSNQIILFIEYLNTIIGTYKDSSILIMTHYNKNSVISINAGQLNGIKKKNVKIHNFGGGADKIYLDNMNEVGLLSNKHTIQNTINIIKEYGEEKTYDYVWDYYWNDRELEENIKTLFDHCLPLAIDLEGLSKTDKTRQSKYYKIIRQDINNIKWDIVNKKWEFIRWHVDCENLAGLIKDNVIKFENYTDFNKELNDKCLLKWLDNLITKKSWKIVTK